LAPSELCTDWVRLAVLTFPFGLHCSITSYSISMPVSISEKNYGVDNIELMQ